MRRIIQTIIGIAGGLSLFVVASPVGATPASGNYTLFGESSLVSPGNNSPTAAETVSDSDPGYGGVDITVPEGLTFGDIETLATDYNVTDDGCAAGSPRFQIAVDEDNDGTSDGNVFAYLGTPPSYTCTPGWQSSGNLFDDVDLIDTSQVGGTFYEPVATAQARLSDATVLGVQLVTDAGYAFPDGEQTVQFDNVMLNDLLVTFEGKESCKNGGWKLFTEADGGPYKNQGQCVSSFNR